MTRQETTRVTNLLDVSGTKRVIRQHGKLGLTKHANILSALEKRALRFRIKGQVVKDKDNVLYDIQNEICTTS